MIIDIISIVGCGVVILLAAISLMMNPFFRKVEVRMQNGNSDIDSTSNLPPISVLVIAHSNSKALDAHLPIILTQDYAPGFEVVVVGEQGDLQMEAAISQFAQCKNLYATYVPKRSLFMSKVKLCVALGVKAAHNEWIVMVDSESKPVSDTWLLSLARRMSASTNLIIGYSNYSEDASDFYRFHRLFEDCYIYRKAQLSTAFRANGTNVAFRRSEFINNDGFRDYLQYVNGEYDFIVNKYAKPNSTATAIDVDAIIREDVPTKKAWHDRNVFNHYMRKRLQRSNGMCFLYNMDQTFMWVNYVAVVGACVFAGLSQRWLLLGVAVLCLIATITLRVIMANKKFKDFSECISLWKVIPYEMSMAFSSLMNCLRFAKSDKADFTTHKL